MRNKIIEYLINKYEPHTIILYGSYADGTNNDYSDFDALIITDKNGVLHDGNEVEGVKLDIFIYNTSDIVKDINYEKYVQLYDGEIIIDKYGIGNNLKVKVIEHLRNTYIKSNEEKEHHIQWCEKMLLRTKRDDIEGYYRWHWLLVDSLEIYFILCDEYYFGPKKSLLKLKKKNLEAFNYYNNALTKFDLESLRQWITYLINLKTIGG